MTTNILRNTGLFFIITLASIAGLGQASPHDLYVGTWKGEMNVGRAMPVHFEFERAGSVLKGFAVDPSGAKKPLTQVLAFASGTVFRVDRDETTFMVFTGKLGADKVSLSGDVVVMQGTVQRGKAAWSAKKVSGAATPAPASTSADDLLTSAAMARDKAVDMMLAATVLGKEVSTKPPAMALMTKALADLDKFITLRPQDHRGFLQRGSLHFDFWNSFSDGSRLKDGVGDLDKAIALSPNNADAFYRRSLLHEALGDKAKAAADMAKYHSLSKR